MRDTLEIGSSPHMEDCVQVMTGFDYLPNMRAQCERFKKLLEQAYPPVGHAFLYINSNTHDFGTYLEVAVSFYDDIKEERYPDRQDYNQNEGGHDHEASMTTP